jgi:hypothetical protein
MVVRFTTGAGLEARLAASTAGYIAFEIFFLLFTLALGNCAAIFAA